MNFMVTLALFGWIPVAVIIFAMLPPRRAVIVSFLAAWMFLPPTGLSIAGLPDYDKATAAALGVLLGVAMFDVNRLTSLRFRLLDIPMLTWCLCPFLTALSNGLGAYEGLSAVLEQTVKWGVPYMIGRAYLQTAADMRELAVLVFLSGLVYVPFCLWEVRMSPNLNWQVYGFGGTGITYSQELGKWGSRPRVFMGNGLAVGMFMTTASVIGVWLWSTRSIHRIWSIPSGYLVVLLVSTAILCKNLGALFLLFLGITVLFAVKWARTPVPVYLLILAAPVYMGVRGAGTWSATPMVAAASMVHPARGRSLNTRLINENRLVDKALDRAVLGWGRWGRGRVYNEKGQDISITDGLWVITLGRTGLVGLVALTCVQLLPVLLVARRYPVHSWARPPTAPVAVVAVAVALYSIDNLFNAMLNPLPGVAIGGLVCLVAQRAHHHGLGRVESQGLPGPTARSAMGMSSRPDPSGG